MVHRAAATGTTSSERTSGRDHRKKRKWNIRKYTENKKEVKKLNPLELIEASCRWYLDMSDTTQGTAEKFINHIAFIASKAKSYKFHAL